MYFCKYDKIFWRYIYLVISVSGFFSNIICSYVFFRCPDIKKTKTNVFRYLLFKSLCDVYILFRNIIYYISNYCDDCLPNLYYGTCFAYMILNHYIGRAALLFSMLLEWAANFNQYRTITNRFQFMDKFKFRYKIMIMFSYCMIFYVFIFFQEDCLLDDTKSKNISSIRYKVERVGFYYSSLGIMIRLIHSFIRDILLEIMIAVISIMTLIYIRHWIVKRKNNLNNDNKNIERSEINLTLMILTTSLVNFIGHIFSFLISLPIDINLDCLIVTSNLLLYISYSINFFIYLAFNKHFQSFFKIKWFNMSKLISIYTISRKFGHTYKTDARR
jgi:hypothetical protein